jgi:hypothetical protein
MKAPGSRGGMNVATTSGLGGGTNMRNGWDKEKREYIFSRGNI